MMYPPLNSYSYSVPYLLLLIILVLLYFGSKSYRLRTAIPQNRFILATFLIFILFWGFRGYICTDWVNYYEFFYDNPPITDWNAWKRYTSENFLDIGYIIYTGIFKIFCSNFLAFQSISYILILLIIHRCIRLYTSDYILSFILMIVFFTVQSINLMRNVIAIAFFLYSIRYIYSKNIWKYIAINAIGVLFHKTALIFIPLYFVLGHRFSIKTLILIFTCAYIVMICQFSIISEYASSIIGDTSGRVNYVLQYLKESDPKLISIGNLERLITGIILILNYNKLWDKYRYGGYFANMMALCLLTYLVFFEINVLVVRISQLFSFAYVIFYTNILDIYEKRKYINLYRIAIFAYVGLWSISTFGQLMYRYDNIILWSHQSYEERMTSYNYYGPKKYVGHKD